MIHNKSKSVLKSACTNIYWYFQFREFESMKDVGHTNWRWWLLTTASNYLKAFYNDLDRILKR